MTMKENRSGDSFNSISSGKGTDPLTFGSKDRYELNDSRMDCQLRELEAKDTNGHSNFIDTDDSAMDNGKGTTGSPGQAVQNVLSHLLSMDNENGAAGSPRKESEDGLSHQLSIWDKDTDSLSSDSSYIIDKEQRSPERESFDTVEEVADRSRSDSRDSSAPLFTYKNVLECDLPELEVCYKEIDCQSLKDIRIDKGCHEKDVNVIESYMNEKSGCLWAEEDLSLASDSSFTAIQCGSKDNDGKTLVCVERLDSCLENSLEMETVEPCESANAAGTGETPFDAIGKAETDSLKENCHVDRKLPIEDFGTQSSFGTDGENKVMQALDQFHIQAPVPESLAASSAEAGGTGNDVLLYNSKSEVGSNTFNFSSPEGLLIGNGMAEDVVEPSADRGRVHEDEHAENLQDAGEAKAQCTGNMVDDSQVQSLISNEDAEEQSTELEEVLKDVNSENLPHAREGKVQCKSNGVDDSHRQSLILNTRNSDGGSATSNDQHVTSQGSSCENAHEGSPDHEQSKSSFIPSVDPAESPSNKSMGPTNDAQSTDPIAPNQQGRDYGDFPVVASHLQHDMGETSFSAASSITYSGPIVFSGSLSHRSDGSTTSGKSFAFPILQSEWNSSPVRMAKADRRHFRKHKGWRSGLLCCRF